MLITTTVSSVLILSFQHDQVKYSDPPAYTHHIHGEYGEYLGALMVTNEANTHLHEV